MFTGLVEGVGRLAWQRQFGEGMDLAVEVGSLAGGLAVGDSVSLSGCCTTVVRIEDGRAFFHLTRETLARTWFGGIEVGRLINLERSLLPSSRMGGHFVQGHVDGLGAVLALDRRQDGADLKLRMPDGLWRYCVEKGSIAIDGVSLTIARRDDAAIMIALIPHTMQVTTLGTLAAGERAHVEVDILAKYVESLIESKLR